MPGLLFVKPKPAYKDTKPGIMSINLDPRAIGEKNTIFKQEYIWTKLSTQYLLRL